MARTLITDTGRRFPSWLACWGDAWTAVAQGGGTAGQLIVELSDPLRGALRRAQEVTDHTTRDEDRGAADEPLPIP